MKHKLLKIFSILFSMAFLSGCKQKGLSDYTTPAATYKTYIEQAKALRIVADHRNYRRAIRCFTKEDRKWFENNYEKLEFEKEEEIYNVLYKTKRLAYVFGKAIVPIGPSPDEKEYNVDSKGETEVMLSVKGYPDPIKIIKEEKNWVLVGLFGIREKVSK
jgi:hypothetical protein